MNDDRRLSTSDLVDAADRAESRRIPVRDDEPAARPDARMDGRILDGRDGAPRPDGRDVH